MKKPLVMKRIITIFIVFVAVLLVFPLFGLRINISDSLPIGLYKTVNKSPQKGDIVIFCLTNNPANIAVSRQYIPTTWLNSKCPHDAQPLMKPIVAMYGDIISISSRGVAVNNTYIEKSKPLIKDGRNRPMPTINITRKLGKNEFIAVTTFNPYSWDSRYYGAIPTDNILSVVRPLWTYEYKSWEK